MDKNKLWEFFKSLPISLKIIALVAVSVLVMIASMSLSACGTPKTVATVSNVIPNSTVTVTMSVSNATTNTPSVDVNDSLKP